MLLNGYDYDDLVEYETTTDDGLRIRLAKVGGGTLGREYAGLWAYSVNDLPWADDLYTGTAKTHEAAAILLSELW